MARAAAGEPTRFLTLTVNPSVGHSQEQRLKLLANAWRTAVKRLRRLYPKRPLAYLAIVEQTKAGEPHLHILLRTGYIPQKIISGMMRDLINAPIVDIRKIRNTREVIRYVAKYITKAPAQFGNAKRYWNTQDWEAKQEQQEIDPPVDTTKWSIDRRPLATILLEWIHDGFIPRKGERETVEATFYGHDIWYDTS